MAQKISEVRVKWPYMIAVNIRPFQPSIGPFLRPHQRCVGGGGAGLARPGPSGDRHYLSGPERPGVGSLRLGAGTSLFRRPHERCA